MTDILDKEISNALHILSAIDEEYRYSQICKLNEIQKAAYKKLLAEFERLNKIPVNAPEAPPNLHRLKGRALEDLVKYLFKISGDIFVTNQNVFTSTNEIDDLITLTQKGKILLSRNLINNRLATFLGECKNYNKPVSVIYIGKFCSLLLTTNVRLGILFSYHGVSGFGWRNGAGLIKKFYLHKENIEERFCVIDFSIDEFNSILMGKNLLQIVEEQIVSLQFDTDYTRHLSKHPAE